MGWQIGYVEPILFVYMMCVFYSMPAEQQLVYHKVCLNHYNKTFCDSIDKNKGHSEEENVVQEGTAKWDMYLNLARTVPAVFSTLVFGAWSDGVGRKKVLMISMTGVAINQLGYFLNAWFLSAPIAYLLIGCFISGICGGFAAILMAIFSYIADITTLEKRTLRILLLDATIFVASMISYPTGGLIIQRCGFVILYGIVIAFYGAVLIYILFLKESYFPEHTNTIWEVIVSGKVTKALHFFTQKREKYHRTKVAILSFAFFILFFNLIGTFSVVILYVYHSPLSFTPANVGYLLAEANAVKAVGACFIGAVLMKKYKWHDYSILLLTTLVLCGQTLCVGLSRKQWHVYASFIWGIGSGAGVSACRSRFSKMASQEDQGKINSIIGIIQVLSTLIGSLACNAIYKATVEISPSIIFYVLAGISTLPLFCSILLIWYEKKGVKYELQINETDSRPNTDYENAISTTA